MMKFTDSKAISFYKMICALAVGFFVLFSFVTPTYAYDENYLGNSKYWIDKGEIVKISSNRCQGTFKYIVDEESGCFYCYMSFYDSLLTEKTNDVSLNFKVKNSKNYYKFSLSEGGVNADEISVIDESFNVYYDFSKVNGKYHGGEIFAAFEFKSTDDRTLKNNIRCEYSCGNDNNFVIIENISVDMEIPTTVKATNETTANLTTKATTKSNTTKKASTSSSKGTTEKSTKFVPSTKKKGSASSKANAKYTTKFSAEKADNIGEAETAEGSVQPYEADSFAPDELTSDGGFVSVQSEKEEVSADRRTTSSEILFAVGITIFALGAFLVLYGVLKGRYKVVKVDEYEEKSKEDTDNTVDSQ